MSDLLWKLTVVVPFDGDWSKNKMWGHGKNGTYLTTPSKRHRDRLQYAIQEILYREKQPVAHNKLTFGYHAFMANHRSDAINAADLVADGVERGCGHNDRWYECGGITWSIDKMNPRLEIWIGQKSMVDSQVCGRCGEVLPVGRFGKGSNPRGYSGTCRICLKLGRIEARAFRANS